MNTDIETLMYRSEAFAEDVFDLVAQRPCLVQRPPAMPAEPKRRWRLAAAGSARPAPESRQAPFAGNESPAV